MRDDTSFGANEQKKRERKTENLNTNKYPNSATRGSYYMTSKRSIVSIAGNAALANKKLSETEKEHTCPDCNKSFRRLRALKEHVLSHTEDRLYLCSICDAGFKSSARVKAHERRHLTGRPHACPECDYRAPDITRMNDHIMIHHRTKSLVCHLCGKSLSTPAILKGHMETHGERTFKCTEEGCDKAFYNKGGLRCHMRSHGTCRRQRRLCHLCGISCTDTGSFNVHMEVAHLNKEKYKCDFCSKVVSTLGSLKNHRRIHTGEKPFLCDAPNCEKAFSAKPLLIIHKRIHTGERKYKCDECDKSFTQRTTLIVHQRSHTGIKPYECEHCPKAYVTKTLLNNHVKSKHV